MRVLGNLVLVKPQENVDTAGRLVTRRDITRGTVQKVGEKINNLNPSDKVLFGSDYEEVELDISSSDEEETITLLLMDIGNIKLVL